MISLSECPGQSKVLSIAVSFNCRLKALHSPFCERGIKGDYSLALAGLTGSGATVPFLRYFCGRGLAGSAITKPNCSAGEAGIQRYSATGAKPRAKTSGFRLKAGKTIVTVWQQAHGQFPKRLRTSLFLNESGGGAGAGPVLFGQSASRRSTPSRAMATRLRAATAPLSRRDAGDGL